MATPELQAFDSLAASSSNLQNALKGKRPESAVKDAKDPVFVAAMSYVDAQLKGVADARNALKSAKFSDTGKNTQFDDQFAAADKKLRELKTNLEKSPPANVGQLVASVLEGRTAAFGGVVRFAALDNREFQNDLTKAVVLKKYITEFSKDLSPQSFFGGPEAGKEPKTSMNSASIRQQFQRAEANSKEYPVDAHADLVMGMRNQATYIEERLSFIEKTLSSRREETTVESMVGEFRTIAESLRKTASKEEISSKFKTFDALKAEYEKLDELKKKAIDRFERALNPEERVITNDFREALITTPVAVKLTAGPSSGQPNPSTVTQTQQTQPTAEQNYQAFLSAQNKAGAEFAADWLTKKVGLQNTKVYEYPSNSGNFYIVENKEIKDKDGVFLGYPQFTEKNGNATPQQRDLARKEFERILLKDDGRYASDKKGLLERDIPNRPQPGNPLDQATRAAATLGMSILQPDTATATLRKSVFKSLQEQADRMGGEPSHYAEVLAMYRGRAAAWAKFEMEAIRDPRYGITQAGGRDGYGAYNYQAYEYMRNNFWLGGWGWGITGRR